LFAGKLTRSTAKNDPRHNICVELQIDGCSAQRHERGERPAAQRGPARSDKRFHSSLQDRRSLVLWLVGWCCCHLDSTSPRVPTDDGNFSISTFAAPCRSRAFRPSPASAWMVRYDRFTSTPAVAGQRSPAGFSLQVGDYCSSVSVAPKAKSASECGEVPVSATVITS
jgi:hypothetical protein